MPFRTDLWMGSELVMHVVSVGPTRQDSNIFASVTQLTEASCAGVSRINASVGWCWSLQLTIDLEDSGIWSGCVERGYCTWQYCLSTNLDKLQRWQQPAPATSIKQRLQCHKAPHFNWGQQ